MSAPSPFENLHGALVIRKAAGISSFGVVEQLQRSLRAQAGGKAKRKELPKLGHGGTLDPFATGVLPICVGNGVKLARYFLESPKEYTGEIHFGKATASGDLTDPVTEESSVIPGSLETIRASAIEFTTQDYWQTPPMHSAKKLEGTPLYELARQGIEVEREAKLCRIYAFEITSWEAPIARFRARVSAGTYIRVLAQDLAKKLGTLARLDSLERTQAAWMKIENSLSAESLQAPWDQSPAWVPFDQILRGLARVQASHEEALALERGQQAVLELLVQKISPAVSDQPQDLRAVYVGEKLVAVLRQDMTPEARWGIERVFPRSAQDFNGA